METSLDREGLIAAMDAGLRPSFRPFYGHTRRPDGALSDACLSQWWRCSFEVGGVRYVTAEQFMMAEKARLFGDDAALAEILAEPEAAKVKALGRKVRGYDDARWGARRVEAVTVGSIAKFSSSPELKAFLLATGDAVLVEAAPRDRIWGVGLGRESPLISEPRRWRGRNLLGFALMRARSVVLGSARP
jgi:hypothetical protein